MLIRKVAHQTARLFSDILSTRTLLKLTGQNIIFPFYHVITDKKLAHIHHLYLPKSTKQFTKDLDFLLKYYRPMDLNDVISTKNIAVNSSKPGFFLSFDDGLKEFYEIIAPILMKKGIPAACFLNSGFVDNKEIFYRYKVSLLCDFLLHHNKSYQIPAAIQWTKNYDYQHPEKVLLSLTYQHKEDIDYFASYVQYDFKKFLETEKPYMTTNQIKELSGQGFYFGAHSIDHPMYGNISTEEQIRQTKLSLQWITDNLDQKTSLFAFPFSDYGVKSSFYNHFKEVDLIFGTAGLKKTTIKNHFQRIALECNNRSAEHIIHGEYVYYILKSMIGKNIFKVYD